MFLLYPSPPPTIFAEAGPRAEVGPAQGTALRRSFQARREGSCKGGSPSWDLFILFPCYPLVHSFFFYSFSALSPIPLPAPACLLSLSPILCPLRCPFQKMDLRQKLLILYRNEAFRACVFQSLEVRGQCLVGSVDRSQDLKGWGRLAGAGPAGLGRAGWGPPRGLLSSFSVLFCFVLRT